MTTTMPIKPHEGKNVKRLREILGIKQDRLAIELNMTQQNISAMEARETIEPELLERISQVLNVPVEAIKNYNDEATMNFVTQNFSDHAVSHNVYGTNNYHSDPADRQKIVELYESLLKTEREKVELLEKQLAEKKK